MAFSSSVALLEAAALCEIALAVSGDIVLILLFEFGGGGVTYVIEPLASSF
jgi:hypothetical protein